MSAVRIVFLNRDGGLSPEITVARPGRGVPIRRVLVAPGEAVLARWIEVPGSTPAQIRAAALALLAPELAAPPEQCAIGLGEAREGRRMVCIADVAQLMAWRTAASARGFAADVIIPDHALLAAAAASDPSGEETFLARRDGMIIARGPDFAFSAEPDLARLLLGDRPATERDLSQDAITWARGRLPASAPNLLAGVPGAAEPDAARRRTSRTALAGVLALLLASAAPWIHAYRINSAANDMRKAGFDAAAAALPGEQISNPRAQLGDALGGYRASAATVGLTAEALAGLALVASADVLRLETPSPGECRVLVRVAAAEELAPMRDHLASRGLAMEETTTQGEDGRLSIDLIIRGTP